MLCGCPFWSIVLFSVLFILFISCSCMASTGKWHTESILFHRGLWTRRVVRGIQICLNIIQLCSRYALRYCWDVNKNLYIIYTWFTKHANKTLPFSYLFIFFLYLFFRYRHLYISLIFMSFYFIFLLIIKLLFSYHCLYIFITYLVDENNFLFTCHCSNSSKLKTNIFFFHK